MAVLLGSRFFFEVFIGRGRPIEHRLDRSWDY
jgi:hypothetical protein